MRRIVVPFAVALATIVGLSACSSGSSSNKVKSASAGPAPVQLTGKVNNKGSKDLTASGAAANASIEADDFSFNPSFVKTAPGAAVTVALKNNGTAQHTFTINGTNVDQTLDPGQQATVTVQVPQTGFLQFHCRFHESRGMQGAFYSTTGDTVTGGGTAPAAASSSTASSTPASSTTASTSGGGGGYHY
jgi:plastocyanin